MKRFAILSALWAIASCINPIGPAEEPSAGPAFELTAAGLAEMFASLPMQPAHLQEVYDAVGCSSGNGYDEEYTLDSLVLRPGAGMGPGGALPSKGGEASYAKARRSYDRPLRELVRDYLSAVAPATRSGVDDLMELLASSGYQLYWPYSDSWDGESYPVITFDPGYGAESNYGYELAPGPDGAMIVDTLEVTEAMAMTRPVWVLNSNSDAAFTPLELFTKGSAVASRQEGCRTSASLHPSHCPSGPAGPSHSRGHGRPRPCNPLAASASAEPMASRPRKLLLRSFKMLRNFDSWFGGASEFFVKCGCVDGFSATSDAEVRLFSPNVTDFMIVVKRRDVGRDIPYEAILVTNFTNQMDNIAFFIMEDDGGTRTNWKCDLTLKIQSKSYGVTVDIPYNEKDDIVWRGQLSRQFFEEEDVVYGRFGDVSCSFELE